MAKTPDGGTITAGQTSTFNIVVTNNGPTLFPYTTLFRSLPNGAALTWATGTAGCTITGSGATQALSCLSIGRQGTRLNFSHRWNSYAVVCYCTGTFPNLATASATNAANVSDPGSIACQQP